jgi:hypothetical protein
MTAELSRHALEQTFAAVRALAVSNDTLVARLEEAADALLSLEAKEMPADLVEDFAGLLNSLLTTEEFSALPEPEAAGLALRILLFHEKLLVSDARLDV